MQEDANQATLLRSIRTNSYYGAPMKSLMAQATDMCVMSTLEATNEEFYRHRENFTVTLLVNVTNKKKNPQVTPKCKKNEKLEDHALGNTRIAIFCPSPVYQTTDFFLPPIAKAINAMSKVMELGHLRGVYDGVECFNECVEENFIKACKFQLTVATADQEIEQRHCIAPKIAEYVTSFSEEDGVEVHVAIAEDKSPKKDSVDVVATTGAIALPPADTVVTQAATTNSTATGMTPEAYANQTYLQMEQQRRAQLEDIMQAQALQQHYDALSAARNPILSSYPGAYPDPMLPNVGFQALSGGYPHSVVTPSCLSGASVLPGAPSRPSVNAAILAKPPTALNPSAPTVPVVPLTSAALLAAGVSSSVARPLSELKPFFPGRTPKKVKTGQEKKK